MNGKDARLILDHRGFSLLEMIIAIAMSGMVGMAAYTIFASSNWSSTVQLDVTEAQQNARVAIDRLAKDIRTAGFGLPDPPFSLDFGSGNEFSSPITVSNSSSGPDTITILGIGYLAGLLENDDNNDGTEDDGECNGSGDSKICLDSTDSINQFLNSDQTAFKSERKYISLDGIRYFELSTTQTDTAVLKLAFGSDYNLDKDFPDGTAVYILQAVQYSIVSDGSLDGCTSTTPCLATNDFTDLRGSGRQALADSIEDIQFAYSTETGGDFSSDPSDPDIDIIAVRANVVARTRNQDPKGNSGFKRPATEDRPVGSSDGYRRRVLSKIIKMRNNRAGS